MHIVEQDHEWIDLPDRDDAMRRIELAARNCYKSEGDKKKSASELVKGLIKKGHESVIEHGGATVRLATDRGVSHELVRHRLAAYSQESTRYCNYSKWRFGGKIMVVRPVWYPWEIIRNPTEHTAATYTKELHAKYDEHLLIRAAHWVNSCESAEHDYMRMLEAGATPQEARAVLPNSLKTEVVMTANMREWRHILRLRASAAAHPQIRDLFQPLLNDMDNAYPELFEDIASNS